MKDGKLIDIIEIHQSILQTFKDERKTVTTYKTQLKEEGIQQNEMPQPI